MSGILGLSLFSWLKKLSLLIVTDYFVLSFGSWNEINHFLPPWLPFLFGCFAAVRERVTELFSFCFHSSCLFFEGSFWSSFRCLICCHSSFDLSYFPWVSLCHWNSEGNDSRESRRKLKACKSLEEDFLQECYCSRKMREVFMTSSFRDEDRDSF